MDRDKIYEEIPRSCFEPLRPCPEAQNPESVLYLHMPDFGPVTEKIRRQTIENSKKYRTDTRLATGRIWTSEKYESWRKQVLSASLP